MDSEVSASFHIWIPPRQPVDFSVVEPTPRKEKVSIANPVALATTTSPTEDRMMSEWISVLRQPPRCYVTYLTQHVDDLCPVPAFFLGHGHDIWLRESEGPEDLEEFPKGKYDELYRPPTHYRDLDAPPEREK